VNGSIGIAVCTHLDPIEDILANADVAMYAAKARGKGTCELYEPNMRHAIVTRVDLESDLRNALDANEFILQYQPIIEVATGTVAGVEALVRWMHPTRGLVPPLDFIPLAEQTGLILPLGKWVLETAAIQAKQWQLEHPMTPPLRVGVNLSARQLQDDGLIDVIGEVLRSTGLEPSSLILEVTESVLMRDTQSTMEVLRAIKQLDVQIAVDDFGTGYSSLSYLKHFPVDVIKIDKSFIDGIENGTEDAKLVRAIIQLGESLGLKTVAEGIETRVQLEELRRLGCKEGQGFYVARPLDQKMMDLVLDKTRFEDDQEFTDVTPEPVG
jgi:EAL domain-containing protein (putative c-di-GMP-specific phosphodiesterase class I)